MAATGLHMTDRGNTGHRKVLMLAKKKQDKTVKK